MADRGVTFAGNGGQDVGDGNMKDVRSVGMQSGGPVKFVGSDQGMTASGDIVNTVGEVPKGSGVKFVGGDW